MSRLDKLAKVSQRKNKRKHGSKSRRRLAKRESRIHQKIASGMGILPAPA